MLDMSAFNYDVSTWILNRLTKCLEYQYNYYTTTTLYYCCTCN